MLVLVIKTAHSLVHIEPERDVVRVYSAWRASEQTWRKLFTLTSVTFPVFE